MLDILEPSVAVESRHYDVCIIGAGAAGITLAITLARNGRTVFLAEGGGLLPTARSQDHYRGDVIGDPYFDLAGTRLRFFGGSTANWGGICRELDPHDFQPKTASGTTAWPIRHDDLQPYAARTAEILQVPRQKSDRMLDADINEVFFEFSPPVRFGTDFRNDVSSRQDIHAFLQCNFVGFKYDGRKIDEAKFVNYNGAHAFVKAKRYVLACGGIENSRILLIENQKFDDKLGNQAGLVGRYWTEHNLFTIGDFFLFDDNAFQTKPRVSPAGVESRRIFAAPSARFLEQRKVLNCGLRLLPLYKRSGAKRHLAKVLCTAPELSNALLEPLGQRLNCAGTIRAAWEQYPDFDNRVALSSGTDDLGLRRCTLYWRKSSRDKLAAREAALALGRYLAKNDLGRIKLAPWLLKDDADFPTDDEIGGNHHMGGTRMAKDSDNGVVDRDCRVFGTSNLYVAGSSVFPSAGHANPTFTIIQLSLRLAEHLNDDLRA